jgi:hypothetical protein
MQKKIPFSWLILKLLMLSGCYKNHLYVQQEWVDEKYLASTRVHTPDPRQANPPKGQKLLVKWDFPKSQFDLRLTLLITVRFWDHSEQVFIRPVERRRDFIDLHFNDLQILTYKVEVFTQSKELLEVWKHHFWTELIDVRADSPRKRSSSVSSQPRQGSVIETP